MAICRDLEKKYSLYPATDKNQELKSKIFKPVDHKKGDIKSQIASIVRYLPKQYHYQSLGAYNALLSLYNITAEEVKVERHGAPVNGLVYVALNESGNKASNPFKASLFGKESGIIQLQKHFEQSKEKMKANPAVKNTIELAMHTTSNETEFTKQLIDQGINTVVRRNNEGRIYGMTFIDHESRAVWNGSQLGKNLSANVFNDWWQNENKPEFKMQDIAVSKVNTSSDLPANNLFEFSPVHLPNLDIGSLSILPEAQGKDYVEEQFENQMRKKKKGRKL